MKGEDMKEEYADDKSNLWKWLKTVPVGHVVDLVDGKTNVHLLAKRYGRVVTVESLSNGDFRVTVIE